MPPKLPPNPSDIRRRLEARGIAVRALAVRLGVNQTHLIRVLSGERPGSRRLLESMAELVETMPGRRPQDDVGRLIDAAVHVFFLKRGDFESEICTGFVRNKEKE